MLQESSFKLKIRNILMGPIAIMVLMISASAAILIVAVPKLSFLLEKFTIKAPLTTRIMIAVSSFFIQEWLWIFLCLAGFVFLLIIILKTSGSRKLLDHLLLQFPLTNQIVRKINTLYVVEKLSLAVAAGSSSADSLENIAVTTNNFYYKTALTAAAEKVKNGMKISEALRPYQNLYSSLFIQMLEVGEETGQIPSILAKLNSFFHYEISDDAKNLALFTEFVLMIIFGVLIGFFAISAIQPLIPFVF